MNINTTRSAGFLSSAMALAILSLAVLGCSALRGDNSNASNGKPANVLKDTKGGTADVPETLDAGDLLHQLKTNPSIVDDRYKGKLISVRGFALSGPTMPGDYSAGILGLQEKGDVSSEIQCRFEKADAESFKKISGDQYVTVKGIFGTDVFPELTSCELLKIE